MECSTLELSKECGDEVGTGHSWNSINQGGLFQAQGIWDPPQKKAKFDRMEGEVGEDVGQKGSGQQGALSPLSPISPSLPSQLFSPAALGLQGFLPDTAEENPSGLNKTVFQDMQSLVFLFFPQVVEPTNGFFPKKKLILTVSSRFRG